MLDSIIMVTFDCPLLGAERFRHQKGATLWAGPCGAWRLRPPTTMARIASWVAQAPGIHNALVKRRHNCETKHLGIRLDVDEDVVDSQP